MDITTIIGWVLGIGVLVFGIMYDKGDPENGVAAQMIVDNLFNFIDVPSIAVVLGGCISGLLSLEGKLNETKDEFLKSSMMLVVDAVEPDKVKQLLETELEYLDERHAQDRAFYDKAGAFGPAFGMIGTLMGLVNLLKQLSDPDKIAPAMALALVTTFYGSCLANMIFIPMSNKLKVRHEEEYLCKMIIAEGVQSIQAGDNPRFIEEKLTNLIPGIMAKKMGGGGGGKEKKGK